MKEGSCCQKEQSCFKPAIPICLHYLFKGLLDLNSLMYDRLLLLCLFVNSNLNPVGGKDKLVLLSNTFRISL